MSTINLKHGIWVMVADGEKALFLRNAGDNKFPNLEVVQEMKQDNPATREQGTDSPGRYNDGPSVHRSAVEDTDWHRIGKERFAEEITARLYKLAHSGEFNEIVLVAPPIGARDHAQEVSQGSRRQGDRRNSQDTDQPRHIRDRGLAAGSLIAAMPSRELQD